MQASSGWTWSIAFILCSTALVAAVAAQPPTPPEELLQDAELCDVFFLDPDVGWAVGDHGLILKTSDGGRHWMRQPAPATCRLESVFFSDAQVGWAVGGYSHPYTHRSTGVVLRTTNGGRSWELLGGLLLPALHYVKFFDRERGWATGSGSSMHPSGVFRTSDGGRSWTAVAKSGIQQNAAGWIAADFLSAEQGAVASYDGRMALVERGQLQPAASAEIGPRPVHRLRLDEQDGWLVGDGGLALASGDGARHWSAPPMMLPEMAAQIDFRALAVWRGQCWLAGAPGTCVLHSSDGGASWSVFRTGQPLPIRGLTFIDENRGWAVGALGMILATRDGGKTWRQQRSGGQRAALLGVFSRAQRVPWELLAGESAEEGYTSAVEIVCRDQSEPVTTAESPLMQRSREAMSAVGGSALDGWWRLPLRDDALRLPASAIIRDWREAGAGPEQLEELIVRRIRQWRPDVIVTENASPRGEGRLAHVVNQVTLRAATKAGDAAQFPEQIDELGLAPWSPKKLLGALPGEERGTINITTAQLAPRLGGALADQAARSRGLVEYEQHAPPANVGLRMLVDQTPQDVGQRGVFAGVVVREGEARRTRGRTAQRNLRELTRIAGKRRTIDEVLKRGAADSQSGFAWLAQVDTLTSGLDPASAADVLYHLGQAYLRAGQPELTAEALSLLVERYPDHSLGEPALVWMVQYYASAEASWRWRSATSAVTGALAVAPLMADEAQADFSAPDGAGGRTALAGYQQTATADDRFGMVDRAQRAADLAALVERTRPPLFADPRLRFPLAASRREAGRPDQASSYYQHLLSLGGGDAWRDCAVGELWIEHRRGQPPKSICRCLRASEKPRLDGRLDDAVWQSANAAELKSPRFDDYQWPAAIMTAYDDEFLYLAASCRKTDQADYAPASGPRPRDPDQAEHDRVEWLIDIDRDYCTYYRLTVDARGWVGDACLGDAAWDPTWYVAAGGDSESWIVEAAVPLKELSPRAGKKGEIWGLGAQRIAPRAGFQSWTTPASAEGMPQGCGWLVFE